MARKRSRRRPAPTQRWSVGTDDDSASRAAFRAAIFEVVDNQLRDDTPPETRRTRDRLLADGYSDAQAREFIAAVVVSEIFEVLQRKEPYDEARYIAALRRLPALP